MAMIEQTLIEKWEKGLELEAGIVNGTNIISFNNTLSHLLYINNNNINVNNETLDVTFNDRTRITISGVENISRFCKSNSVKDVPHHCIKKTRVQVQDIADLNTRIRLSKEETVEFAPQPEDQIATFRIKKRLSVTSVNEKYRYDFTIIKQSSGQTFINAKNQKEHREIEMEYVGEDIPDAHEFNEHLKVLLTAYYNDPLLTPLSVKTVVLSDYINVCKNMNFINKNNNVDELITHTKKIFKNVFDKGFSKTKHFCIGAKPVTLEKEQLSLSNPNNIFTNYKVTIKADGDRTFVFVDNNKKIYLVDFNLNVKFAGDPIGKNKDTLKPNTIYDGELVTNKDNETHILFFDCYVYNNEDVSQKSLADRIDLCHTFNTKHYKFQPKQYHDTKDVRQVLKAQYKYETDGVIYMPTGSAKVIGTWDECYKWKPPNQNTIDFIVTYVKDSNNNRLEMYERGEKQYILNAFVGSTPVSPKSYFQSKGKKYIAIPFVTDAGKTHFIKIKSNQKCDNGDVIEDNYVVECYYNTDDDHWVPYRVRFDKTWDAILNKTITGNNIKSALNIWSSIVYPIDINDLSSPSIIQNDVGDIFRTKYYERKGNRNKMNMSTMNRLHNQVVKNDFTFRMLKNAGCKSLMDIACGKGGDLHKWLENNFETVLGIDVVEDNIINPIDGAYKRLSESKVTRRHKYVFVPSDSSIPFGTKAQLRIINDPYTIDLVRCLWGSKLKPPKELQYLQGLGKSKFDVVSCQFAIHYFFENDEKIEAVLSNVRNNLKKGGFFVGTCFDGDTVLDLLKLNNGFVKANIQDKTIWSIDANGAILERDSMGQKVSVFVESINKTHDEYLVPFSILREKMKKYGLRELNENELRELHLERSSYMFEDILKENTMSLIERQFSHLNRWFIFKMA